MFDVGSDQLTFLSCLEQIVECLDDGSLRLLEQPVHGVGGDVQYISEQVSLGPEEHDVQPAM